MRRNHVFEKRPGRLEELVPQGYIPFLHGRPVRDIPISKDDMVNLRIALNTAEDLEEFVQQV
jgi:hypothetical protein